VDLTLHCDDATIRICVLLHENPTPNSSELSQCNNCLSTLVILFPVFDACTQVDVEANPFLAKAESIDFVPTFKIYKNGFKVKELLGPTQEALEHAVSHYNSTTL
jgi:hypothetical protein